MSIDLTQYPTEAALVEFLVNSGVVESVSVSLELYQLEAINWLETFTGWRPFLADTVDTFLLYDIPVSGRELDLQTGFVSVTSVEVGLDTDGSNGTVLTVNEDYRLIPYQDGPKNWPIWKIWFRSGVAGMEKSIKVTGQHGAFSSLPPLIYGALLREAAARAYPFLPGVGGSTLGAVTSITQGPVTYKMDEGSTPDVDWHNDAKRAAAEYQRDVM